MFADEIGAPHPPDMSFGVKWLGTLPRSTPGAAGFVEGGSGAPQAFVSLPAPHGSNMLELVEASGWDTGARADGLDAVLVGDERLNAELKLLLKGTVGEATLGAAGAEAGAGAGSGALEANPPKSSAAKRSAGTEVGTGFGGGAVNM